MKKRVHYATLKDMAKYIKGFNPDDYESCYESTDPSVIAYVRTYYDKHLPVDVNAWMRVNKPEYLIDEKDFVEQVIFVRDTICNLLWPNYEEWKDNPPLVISTHCSKSVKLPVYQINLEKYGIEMVLRYNFYDWKVSVKSDKPLNVYTMGLFNPTEKIPSNFCEGFPRKKIYGSYMQNQSQFTIQIASHYDLYTFIFLLSKHLGIK